MPIPWSFSSCRTYQLESRMREIRQSGSEGGGAGEPALPTPISHHNQLSQFHLHPFFRVAGHFPDTPGEKFFLVFSPADLDLVQSDFTVETSAGLMSTSTGEWPPGLAGQLRIERNFRLLKVDV
jgi:hypothetical protein